MAKSAFFLYRIVAGRGAGRRLRAAAAAASAVSLLGALALSVPGVAVPALASGGSAQLLPAAGQFFPVAPVRVADTRYGTGGVPAQPVASGGTITFTVTGKGQVPSSGVSDVYVLINAISPQYSGCLSDYAADVPDPNICTVSFEPGLNMSGADIVQVSSSGQVSVTNESGGTTDVVVSVMGYVQDDTAPAAGETYVPVPQAQIVDTRSGLGAPQAQIPAGGSLTVQVSGAGGLAPGQAAVVPSDAAGAALFIGAANATQNGWVSAYPAGGTASSLAILSYQPDRKARDLYFGALSSSGQLTLVNQGSAAVDLMVGVEGYLVSPSAAEAGGTYQDVTESRIVDTRDGKGGVPAAPVPAGGSITFTATGAGDVPSSGVLSVAESVAAIGPAASGYLSVYPADGTDPANPGVNFTAGDYQDNDIAAPLSSSGQQTITNHSSGTVDVVVSVRGFYVSPIVASAPGSVSASVSGSSATVTWSPPGSDGGAAITGYTVTASPDSATVTVAGVATQATLTGLANASADMYRVTASNVIGVSAAATWAPADAITGTVVSPNSQPVASAPVAIAVSDVPSSNPSDWTSSLVGTATTDANGIWTFTVPPYSALPADAQAAADNNGGWLNMDVWAAGHATVGQNIYAESAVTARSAWVGTSSQPSGPVQVATSGTALPVMTVTPDQADLSSQDTTTAEQSTWTYNNSPSLVDVSNNIIGIQANANAAPPVDPYGYQSIDGSVNDGYSPYVAANGTDLSQVSATGGSAVPQCINWSFLHRTTKWQGPLFTTVGEFHINWDGTGGLSYSEGATSNIGVMVGADAKHFTFSHYNTYENTRSSDSGPDGVAPQNAGHVLVSFYYYKIKSVWTDSSEWPADSDDKTCYTRWAIKSNGVYYGGDSYIIWTTPGSDASKDMWAQHDGYKGYLNYFPRSQRYRNRFGGDGHLCVSNGTGYTYGWAATLGGIGIQAETDHSSYTQQCDHWGNHTRQDEIYAGATDGWHWAWGSNKKAGENPKIFYNY